MPDPLADGSHEVVVRLSRPFNIWVAGEYLTGITEIMIPFDGQEAADTAAAAIEVTARPWAPRPPGGTLAWLRSQLREKDAEIARLTAELDGLRLVPVEYAPTAALEAAMAVDPGREDGTILRETGGERRAFEWKAAARQWVQIA